MAQPEADQQRADRRRRAQQPQTKRPGVQNILRINRQQRGCAAQQHGEEIERNHAQHVGTFANKAYAGEQR